MSVLALEGDWELISDKVRTWEPSTWQQLTCLSNLQGYDPVKLTIKAWGADWMVACMIPKGNMMASMLKKVDDGFNLVNFDCSEKKETPKENKELEEDFKIFLAKGISNLVVKGNYIIT